MCCTGLWSETVNQLSDALVSESSQNMLINQWMASFQHLTLEALSIELCLQRGRCQALQQCFHASQHLLARAILAVFSLSLSCCAAYQLCRITFAFLWHFDVIYFEVSAIQNIFITVFSSETVKLYIGQLILHTYRNDKLGIFPQT